MPDSDGHVALWNRGGKRNEGEGRHRNGADQIRWRTRTSRRNEIRAGREKVGDSDKRSAREGARGREER